MKKISNKISPLHALSIVILFLLLVPAITAAKDSTQKKPPATPVVVAMARLTELAPVTWVPGTVISRNDARLATEVEGNLKMVAEVGDRVREDDVLAKVDDTFVRLRIEELSAAVEKEKAQLTFYTQEVQRLKRLAKENNTAQTRLEQTEADRDVAQNNLNIAKTRLRQAKEEQWRHVIRAPFPGVVSERFVRPGERAKTGDAVLRLVDTSHLEIQARAPLSAVSYINEGSLLRLRGTLDDQQGLQSRVRALVPVGNERARMMDLRLKLEAKSWRVGQSVRVALPTAVPKQVLAVPRDALVLRRDGASLFRLSEDKTAEKVSVSIGIAAGDLVEVSGKLNPGDLVVVRGGERLRPGQAVKILEELAGGS